MRASPTKYNPGVLEVIRNDLARNFIPARFDSPHNCDLVNHVDARLGSLLGPDQVLFVAVDADTDA